MDHSTPSSDAAAQPEARSSFTPIMTLTGIDDSTPLNAVRDLDLYPVPGRRVEWGVLYSAAQAGFERYPSLATIEAIARMATLPGAPRFALHICGSAVLDYLAGRGHVYELAQAFPRVQLNLRVDFHPDFDALCAKIANRLCDASAPTLITQHNAVNAPLTVRLAGLARYAVLLDESGGRGRQPAAWPAPLENVLCGYAGGLGPENLAAQLPRIHAAAAGAHYWIDMESGLRNEAHCFDLDLARTCLRIVCNFYGK